MPTQRSGEPADRVGLLEEPKPLPDAISDLAPAAGKRGPAATLLRNSAMNIGRLGAGVAVALVLPAYLAHKLPVKVYSAWVLILQMGAYVGYLDFGVQTAIAKYVAEYEAQRDPDGLNKRASAGLAIILVAGVLGVLLTLLLAWRVPTLFREMPPALFPDVRISLIFVGVSLSFGLLCSVPAAIFIGLQRFGIPSVITLVNRVLYSVVIVAAVFRHSSLAAMGAGVALVNVVTGLLQVVAWRRLAGHVRLSLRLLESSIVKGMLSYCSILAIWSAGMLCVVGLDVTIVGRYDFSQTAFYSIATLPTNFLISLLGAALGPLMPAASAMGARNDPDAMGSLLARVTRYCTLMLCLTGLPLMVCGFWILRFWVGPAYALHAVGYLRILVLANMIRCVGLPYATMLVATERQKVATAGAVAEAVVNVVASIYLAQRMGAMGVALGTVLGSLVSIGMHFAVAMHFTYRSFRVTRSRLFVRGIAIPLAVAVPSLLCARLWWSASMPSLSVAGWIAWAVSSLILGWFAGLAQPDRLRLLGWGRSFIKTVAA